MYKTRKNLSNNKKRTKTYNIRVLKNILTKPLYLENITKYSSHKFMPSMRMTKYGDF